MTSLPLEANIELSAEMVAPDSYAHLSTLEPPGNFVVSRKRDGSVASRYGEMSWDWTCYVPDGESSKFHFRYWTSGEATPIRKELVSEMRWLMFIVIWIRTGTPWAYGTLISQLTILRHLARYCEAHGYCIRETLNDLEKLIEFIRTYPTSDAKALLRALDVLFELGPEKVGFNVIGSRDLRDLRLILNEYSAKLQQHPPIPSRIYSQFIASLLGELDDFAAIANTFLELTFLCATDPLYGRDPAVQRSIQKRSGISLSERNPYRPTFPELLKKFSLDNYFLSKKLDPSVKGLGRGLVEVQEVAKLLIHTYSGMRDREVLSLPYSCLDAEICNGKTHYFISGTTTKFNNGNAKRTRWVTSAEGMKAIQLAQKIADTIYSVIGATPTKSNARLNDYSLLISTSFLRFGGSPPSSQGRSFRPSVLDLSRLTNLRSRLQPTIQENDIRELEKIDPHRAWRSEAVFNVGSPWSLTTHQLRRSLALYAQRSGLVSLPSLRRQLQHITQAMSQYYAKGSAFAKNFVAEDTEHFGQEWQDTTPTSSALSYICNVIFSDEKLFGGHGTYIEQQLRKVDSGIDRDSIIRQFKKGEIAYKETPLGGCVKVGECDDVGFRLLDIDCLSGCRNLVGKVSKLKRVIAAQSNLVESLDPDSVQFRMEKSDLDILSATLNRLSGESPHEALCH